MNVGFWLSYAGVTAFILIVLFSIVLWSIVMILGWIGIKKYENYKRRKRKSVFCDGKLKSMR